MKKLVMIMECPGRFALHSGSDVLKRVEGKQSEYFDLILLLFVLSLKQLMH